MSRSEAKAHPTWGKRLTGMEGLRGIAATSVLVGHVQAHLAHDVVLSHPVQTVLGLLLNGLTLFFALSGFLLFRPFAAAIVRGTALPRARRFFTNRALRIYPAYVVILLLVCLVLGAAYTRAAGPDTGIEGVGATVGYLTNPWILLANLTMLHTLFPFSIKTGLGASWSLTVELVFYLSLPVISWLAWRSARGLGTRLRGALACAPAGLLLAVGLLGRLVTARTTPASSTPEEQFYWQWGSNWHAVLARSFFSQADLFAFGMLAAVGIVLVEQGLLTGRRLILIRVIAALSLVVAVWGGRRAYLTSDTWWALGCGGLIFLVAAPDRHHRDSVLAWALEWLPFRYVGLVSYSTYLWHQPVIWVLDEHGLTAGQTRLGMVANVALVFTVSLLLSSITYFAVERPALRLKDRMARGASARRNRRPLPWPVAGSRPSAPGAR